MFICAICISSLGRFPGFLSIVNWIVCSLVVVFYECFVYFEYQSFIRYVFCKYFSPELLL